MDSEWLFLLDSDWLFLLVLGWLFQADSNRGALEMRIKLYENRDFMRRTQIKLMQEEVHIWCIRWKEVIPVFEYYQLMLDQKEKD